MSEITERGTDRMLADAIAESDELRGEVASLAAKVRQAELDIEQWKANSRENKLIAESAESRVHALEKERDEARADVAKLLDETRLLREKVAFCIRDSEQSAGRVHALESALREISRLRLATDEGSLRVRSDQMWHIAEAVLRKADPTALASSSGPPHEPEREEKKEL